ncbi:GDP-L-fucose synthase [Mesorhizobium albiziae]|uniref:GDP-L-fucose synthase n=1 Tax=Neomesorhizobium albiziae TaxID=335020 RepID=A0A1I4EZC9_9HYPH|nr:GDP-L-fucose synthase [Mesorhizobium albiziae]GLS33114.1 GDP-L-fucose synthase [Mesorhizobium albiziae]SFL11082.1 GDP-L-fucose synthase [Mesorhizobium albiziae]
MISLEGKRIWVAGHRGMVGSALVRRLSGLPEVKILTADSRDLDLTDRAATTAWVRTQRPDLVFMAAAKVGGILANNERPVDFLQDNLAIELSTIAAAFEACVEKFMLLGSSCIYPKFAAQPIQESSLMTAPLEPTNQWYAIAKIAGVMLCDAYRQQFGRSFISTMPTNLYGPNDNFDPLAGHVMAATIRKIVDARSAGRNRVTIWGSGSPLREFMHVDDLADALVFLMERYDEAGPINVGSGQEISVLGLHQLVAELSGWQGEFDFDRSKPDGTPRKLMDSSRLTALGWRPRIELRDGLRQMIDIYGSTIAVRPASL